MKQIKILTALAFTATLLSCNSSPSDTESVATATTATVANTYDFVKKFEGQLNNKYEILAKITSNAGQLTGYYLYKMIGQNLQLKGTIDNSGNLTLNEYDDKRNQTGIFSGKYIGNRIAGTWSKPNGEKSMPFQIIESNSTYEATQQVINAKTEKSVYESLQGRWQSIDDAKSVIEFKDEYYADYYDNHKGEENKFWLDKACPDTDGSGNPGENEKYLVVGDMCWYINDISETRLELIYTARGNTLTYKRIK